MAAAITMMTRPYPRWHRFRFHRTHIVSQFVQLPSLNSVCFSLSPSQHARKVWIRHAKFLFASAASAPATAPDGSGTRFDATRPGLLKAARGLLRRALAVLPQHKHVRTIIAFACLECVHRSCYPLSSLSSFCGGGHKAATTAAAGVVLLAIADD